jgi:hypothetical protein
VYQAGPAGLFDSDFREQGVLSIDERDTSVMLIDCRRTTSSRWPNLSTETDRIAARAGELFGTPPMAKQAGAA